MLGILGKKIGMTQIFKDGDCIPVTVIEAGPCKVLYKGVNNGIALGFDKAKIKSVTKPMKGKYEKISVEPLKFVREFKTEDSESFEIGQELNLQVFEGVEFVDVTGISIGKGFQGGVKRHGFAGGPASHGASLFHRGSGSIGPRIRVRKGLKMAGRMGGDKVTVQNLKIVSVDLENNLLLVRGAIPGTKEGYVVIKPAVKKIKIQRKGR